MTSPTFYKFLRGTLIATALVFMPIYAFADYYVATTGSDSNSGTQSAPFRTIQKAANNASPGITIHVAPGTYAETITSSVNGTASARIRYVSDTKWGAKIVPVTGAYEMWSVSGGYTDIDGFQIDGTGGNSVRIGIGLSGGNSSVKNSLIQHVAETSGCDSQGSGALHASQSRGPTFINYDFIGNVVHHNGVAGCGWDHGIYHQSTGNIKNNLIYANPGGINMYHDDHNINVVNNTVFGNSSFGINFGGCQEAYNNGCPTSGINIYNNIVYDNPKGIAGAVTANDVNNVIHNNLVFGNTLQYDLASPSLSSITGAVNADPQFVNYIRGGGGDYHLKSTSPAIDRGTSSLAPSTDLDGKVRPQGAGYDIGAYEYGGTITPPPPPSSPPTVSLSPTSLNFGSVLVGTASAVQVVTITNTGTVALTFGVASMTGDFTFGGTGTCSTGVSYASGASCTDSVKFTPTVSGTRTGTLTITDNAGNSPQVVQLTGTGGTTITPPPLPPPPPITTLTNGVVLTSLSGATGATHMYSLTVPAGATNLRFVTSGGSGDMDIYAKFGSQPTSVAGGYDAKSDGATTAETISIPTPQAGTYYLLTNGWAAYSGVSLVGAYTAAVVSGPAVSLSPTALNFGSVTLGNSSTVQLVTITNTGTAALTFGVATMTGDFSFGGTGTCSTGVSYAPGASCTNSVKFTPTLSGTRTGTLTITDNAGNSPQVVQLSGTGGTVVTSGPVVSLSSTSLSFGSVTVGTASAPQALTITNTGTTNLSFTAGFAFTGDFNGSGNCYTGTALIPGANCVLNVTFTPTVSGTRTGTVTITTNAAGSPNVIQLSGTGGTIASMVTLTPASVNFGSIAIGASSPVLYATFTNNSTAVVTFNGNFVLTGDFATAGVGTCGATVAVGGSCTVSLKFTPTVTGTRTGTLTINSNAAGSPHIVSLTGTGGTTITPPPPPPPPPITTLTNGVVLTSLSGATGATHMYQLTVPAGATNLRFVSSGGTGDFDLFVKFGSQPTMTVYDAKSVGATTAETVSFAAPQAGTYYLLTNGWAAYSGVSLVGAYNPPVVSASVTLTPSSVNFGSVNLGSVSSVFYATFTNNSTAVVTFNGDFVITGDFTTAGVGTCGATVAAGTSCTVSLKFTPTVAGTRTGTLTINSDAAGAAPVVSLSGVGGTTATPVPAPSPTPTPATGMGDGIINGVTEVCDDGNQTNGDGCSAAGAIEAGFTCTGEPSVCGRVVYVGGSSSSDTYRCDGTGDQVPLNSALAYAYNTVGYKGVHIRSGVACVISDTVKIYNNTALEGEAGAKIMLANGAGWPAGKAMIEQAQSPASNISIRNLEIDGNRANQSEASGYSFYTAIKMSNITGFTAHDLNVHHNLNDSIKVDPGSKLHFFRNRCDAIGHDCYYLLSSSNIRIHDDPLLDTGTDSGVRLVWTKNVKVYREHINGIAGGCFEIQGSGSNIELFENTCRDAVQGIWAYSFGTNAAADVYLNVHHNIFTTSRGSGSRVHGMVLSGFNADIKNNVIWGINGKGISNTQLYTSAPSGSGYVVNIQNNIIGSNAGYGIDNQYTSTHTYNSSYNCFYQNVSGNYAGLSAGTGDLNTNPLFVSAPADFHLQSGSLCKDAGNPSSSYSLEPAPNGGRIDIGRYGNTTVSGGTLVAP